MNDECDGERGQQSPVPERESPDVTQGERRDDPRPTKGKAIRGYRDRVLQIILLSVKNLVVT